MLCYKFSDGNSLGIDNGQFNTLKNEISLCLLHFLK